jgi:hypothetical protein
LKIKSRLFSAVLINAAFLCYKQICPGSPIITIRSHDHSLHMRNSEYSSYHLPSLPCEGEQVYPRRCGVISRLQLASEKQGRSILIYQLLVGREKGPVPVPMGGPLRRLWQFHFSAIRSVLISWITSVFHEFWYNSIPITLMRTALRSFFMR